MGDLEDNIRGVEGIGKRDIILFVSLVTYWILHQLPLPGKQKYIQNPNASEELFET